MRKIPPSAPTIMLVAALAFTMLAFSSGSALAQPSNDDFANATVIGSLPFIGTVSIGEATAETNEPFFCTYMPQTVWYRYQPTTSGYVKLGLTSDVPDAFVEVFSGTSFDNLGAVGCLPSAQGEQFFFLQAGSTYYFQVGTQSVESGQIGLTLQQPKPPTNDDFDNATRVNSPLFKDFIDMSQATVASDDPTDCFSGLNSVWYAVTPTTDTKIGVTSTLGQPGFSVYTGTRGSLHLIGCGGPQVFDATKGVTYYIEVLYGDASEVVIGEAFRITQVSVNPTGSFSRATKAATISGTLTCNATIDAIVTVDLTQRHGSSTAHGRASLFTSCSTAGNPWTVTASPDAGQFFTPGPATVTMTAYAGGIPPFYNSDSRTVSRTVQLVATK